MDVRVVQVQTGVLIEADAEEFLHVVPEPAVRSFAVRIGIVDEAVLNCKTGSYDFWRIPPLHHLRPDIVIGRQQDSGIIGRIGTMHAQIIPCKDHILLVRGKLGQCDLRLGRYNEWFCGSGWWWS